MNRCNKDTVEKKYGQYPMTWNSPGGCVDFWLIGHEDLDKWSCVTLRASRRNAKASRRKLDDGIVSGTVLLFDNSVAILDPQFLEKTYSALVFLM